MRSWIVGWLDALETVRAVKVWAKSEQLAKEQLFGKRIVYCKEVCL